jgi:DNA polymerase-1
MSRPTVLPPAGAEDVLYLIDFSGYVFRAYHAVAPLSSSTGEPTHATFGTVAMIQKLIDQRKPVYLGVAMDSTGPRLRTGMDARYKAHRPAPPDDLIVQMKRSREFVEAYRIPIFIADGLEADDLIAVATARALEKGLRVVIASSDKDLMQLVDGDRVVLWDAMRDRIYGTPEVIAKFGVPPSQIRDLLALVGDTSDNVPGVPGVGMKTGAELLTQFGSLDALYARLGEVKKVKIRESLQANEGEARLSQQLVTLDVSTEVNLELDTLRYASPDTERLRALFAELGFGRFLKALPAPAAAVKVMDLGGDFSVILTRADLEKIVAEAGAAKRIAFAVWGTSPEPMRAQISGIALATAPGRAAYLPVSHRYLGAPAQLSLGVVREVLGPLLADPAVRKIGHDLKYSEVLLHRNGMALAGAEIDTMLASYLLDPEAENTLEALADRDAGVKVAPLDGGAPKKRGQAAHPFDELDVAVAGAHAARLSELTLGLAERYAPRLRDARLDGLLRDLELPLSHILAGMEETGVLVDPKALDVLGKTMTKELATLEEKARAAAGQDFNLGSPKQLETILFDVLGLKATKKTKTGRSTDAEVLESLAEDHALPALVLEHRAIAKLKGTYVDALPRLMNPETGRIHTRWSQAVAATGRLSSQDPNLQNIPIRSELGKIIRRAFIAPEGAVILSADYSQIELRVLAHLSKDPVLVDAFRTGQDVHVRTAMEIFNVTAEGVTDEMRGRSKTINFGVIYGMGEGALAKRLGIPRQEAARFIDAYFERYAGVRKFMDETMESARKTEVVHTLFGRRRLLPDLRNTDPMRRAQAERIAKNTPIQGTSADLLKLAMVRLAEPVVPGARMVLTVHDELVFEVPEGLAKEAGEKVRKAMETAHDFDVPLVVDVGWGRTWADS